MAAGIIEVVAKWQYASNIPEDCAINTFHFELSDDADTTMHAAARNRITQFYAGATAPQVNALGTYLASYINTSTGNSVTSYRLADPKPRAPYGPTALTKSTPTSTANLPFEVAVCGSFKCDPIPGIGAGRLRNRIYLGPLNESARTTTANQPTRPATVLQGDLARAFLNLKLADTSDVVWVGYSPTGSIGWEPTTAWVDNEFDTQRRRGQGSTSRFTQAL